MKQSITISNILNHINQALQNRDYQNPEAMEALCRNMMFDLTSLLNDDIDFKAVVDALDDRIIDRTRWRRTNCQIFDYILQFSDITWPVM